MHGISVAVTAEDTEGNRGHRGTEEGLQFQRQVPLGVTYSTVRIAPAYRIDFIIEGIVILDIKSVERILPVHRAQVLSYLKLTGLPLGLVLNFKVPHLRDGIARLVNAPESEL